MRHNRIARSIPRVRQQAVTSNETVTVGGVADAESLAQTKKTGLSGMLAGALPHCAGHHENRADRGRNSAGLWDVAEGYVVEE